MNKARVEEIYKTSTMTAGSLWAIGFTALYVVWDPSIMEGPMRALCALMGWQ